MEQERERMLALRNRVMSSAAWGTLANPLWQTVVQNQACGDRLVCMATESSVASGTFEYKVSGESCLLSRVVAVLIAEKISNQPQAIVDAMTYDALRAMLPMPVGPNREQCVRMVWDLVCRVREWSNAQSSCS